MIVYEATKSSFVNDMSLAKTVTHKFNKLLRPCRKGKGNFFLLLVRFSAFSFDCHLQGGVI